MKILLVEDDRRMSELIHEVLTDALYLVDTASTGELADELIHTHDYQMVVLDWELPDTPGIELLKRWRRGGIGLPVLMLTGRHEVADRTGGLDAGADDYLIKPFAFSEMLARVRSLLRRVDRPIEMVLSADDLSLDAKDRSVRLGGTSIPVSPREYAVLELLLRRKNEVLSRAEIEEGAWDSAADPMANVVDVTIARLRKKIDRGRPAKLLHTVRGAGYMLRSERC